MRSAKVIAIMLVTVLLWWGCRKKVSPIPSIEFIEQDTYEVADSGIGVDDDLIFTFLFEDGDSDVGPIEGTGASFPSQNIVFMDARDSNNLMRFDFPPIPNDVVTDDGVKGSFDVRMSPKTIFARTDTTIHKLSDTVFWHVYIVDEKNNQSNWVNTDSVVIIKK